MYDEVELSAPNGSATELTRLNEQIRNLRIALRSRQVIDNAIGMLMERYRMAERDVFQVLQQVSSRCNIKTRTLAEAIVSAPRPVRGSSGPWFQDQPRMTEPPLRLIRSPQRRQLQRTGLLNALLFAAMDKAGERLADAQVVESGALRLEVTRGFSTAFVEFFTVLEEDTTPCTRAMRLRRAVSVSDVATDQRFAQAARMAALDAGVRSVYSVPMLAPTGACVGVFTIHFARPGKLPSVAEQTYLGELAAEAGAWLHWHRSTAMVGALEYLHQLCSGNIKH